MQNLHEIVSLIEAALDESHLQTTVWKGEIERLLAMVTMLVEVEDCGLDEFLKENMLQQVDARLV